MFGLQRKIGTGTTSRRRPARECKVGIESLDTRAVPALVFPSPGSPLLESGTGAFGATISNVAFDKFGHGFAQTQITNPFTPGAAPTVRVTPLLNNLAPAPPGTIGAPVAIPGVTGANSPNPLTLAYRLPTPVADGDVLVVNYQTQTVDELIRFQTASDPVTGTSSWMLVYSTNTNPAFAGPTTVSGIPTYTINGQLPLLTQVVPEFGVQGGGVVEYGAEQAIYSGLVGNAVPFNFTTATTLPIGAPIGAPPNGAQAS